jgi:hypothetical protein
MTRRSKADRKRIQRTPRPGPSVHFVDMRWDMPQCPPEPVSFLGCMTGGRFAQCDCLVCLRRLGEAPCP